MGAARYDRSDIEPMIRPSIELAAICPVLPAHAMGRPFACPMRRVRDELDAARLRGGGTRGISCLQRLEGC